MSHILAHYTFLHCTGMRQKNCKKGCFMLIKKHILWSCLNFATQHHQNNIATSKLWNWIPVDIRLLSWKHRPQDVSVITTLCYGLSTKIQKKSWMHIYFYCLYVSDIILQNLKFLHKKEMTSSKCLNIKWNDFSHLYLEMTRLDNLYPASSRTINYCRNVWAFANFYLAILIKTASMWKPLMIYHLLSNTGI